MDTFNAGKIIDVEKSANNWARFIENGVRKYVNISYLTKDIGFSDIDDHWAKDSIEFLKEYNILHGNGKNVFQPEKKCTKAEMATMVYNMIKSVKDGVFYE